MRKNSLVTYESVKEAIESIAAQKQKPSYNRILEITGGSKTTIVKMLRLYPELETLRFTKKNELSCCINKGTNRINNTGIINGTNNDEAIKKLVFANTSLTHRVEKLESIINKSIHEGETQDLFATPNNQALEDENTTLKAEVERLKLELQTQRNFALHKSEELLEANTKNTELQNSLNSVKEEFESYKAQAADAAQAKESQAQDLEFALEAMKGEFDKEREEVKSLLRRQEDEIEFFKNAYKEAKNALENETEAQQVRTEKLIREHRSADLYEIEKLEHNLTAYRNMGVENERTIKRLVEQREQYQSELEAFVEAGKNPKKNQKFNTLKALFNAVFGEEKE